MKNPDTLVVYFRCNEASIGHRESIEDPVDFRHVRAAVTSVFLSEPGRIGLAFLLCSAGGDAEFHLRLTAPAAQRLIDLLSVTMRPQTLPLKQSVVRIDTPEDAD